MFQVAAAFPLRVTVQGQKSNLKKNKTDIKNKTIEDVLPDYAKSVFLYYSEFLYLFYFCY